MRVAPNQTQIEINLFGGGNAYGEAILIHLGYDHWIVVDSLKNPRTRSSVILEYFEEIGKDPSSIKLIVASHWHDDHIKGISDIYKSSNCRLSISQALPKEYIAKLVSLDEFKQSENSGLNEFGNVIRSSIEKRSPLIRAIQDRPLLELNTDDCVIKVTALSPSDRAIEVFEQELAEILNDAYDLNLACKRISPNHSSIVLLVQIENTKILLGADLEIHADQNMGWNQVCKSSSISADNSVEVFKIPHHGSENGHYGPVWEKFISKDHIAILTPYGRGKKKLPSMKDKERILITSPESFITSHGSESSKPKKRDRKVNKILKELSYKVRERKFTFGHIQLRRPVNSNIGSEWEVLLHGNAKRLQDFNV
ncbi:MAG: MBL fold metallo-hydrolase [Saprospiraceae bacterium]